MASAEPSAAEVAAQLRKRRKTAEITAVQAVDETSALKEQVAALEHALEAKDRRIDAMKDIGRSLGAILDLDEVLALIMRRVTELLEADRSTLYLVDNRTHELWSKIAQGDNVQEIRLPVGVGIAGWVAKAGEPLNLRDAYADRRFNPAVDKRTGYKTQNMLAFPMRDHRGGVLGVIQALNKKGGFTEEDERTLEAIASQAAAAVENAVLYKEALQKNQELSTTRDALAQKLAELDLLFEFSQTLSGARDTAETTRMVLQRSAALVGAQGAMLMRLDGPVAHMHALDTEDRQGGIRSGTADPAEGIIGWVASKALPVIVADVQKDKRHSKAIAKKWSLGTVQNACGVPLLSSDGACGGALVLYNRPAGFTEDHVVLLTMLANHVARILETARAKEQDENARRLATIGQMLSGVVHDFKTPMTIISGYVQLMQGSADAAERKEYAELVLKQFDNLSQMTRDLLQFARGEVEVLLRKVYVQTFLSEVEEMLTQLFLNSDVKWSIDARFKGTVRMDQVKMMRVVSNIARNAKEAMRDGGSFTVTVQPQGESILVVMADTGPGIPEELEGRLFQEFATHGKEGGTGLGLAVVKRIVQEHRGDITYESRRGKGTTFTVRLPL